MNLQSREGVKMKKGARISEPVEAEIVGKNPSRKYHKSADKSAEAERKHGAKVKRAKPIHRNREVDYLKIFRINRIIAVLILILLICALGLILKFLVGVLAWLLQFAIVAIGVVLIFWLIYSLISKK
jgi:hypothetical protein